MRKMIFIILALSGMVFQCNELWAIGQGAPVAMDIYVKDVKAIPMVVTLRAAESSRFENFIYEIVSQPSQGSLKAVKFRSPADSHYVYTPDIGFTGEVTFTYEVRNANGVSDPATVTIMVGKQKTSTVKAAVLHKTPKVPAKRVHHQTYFVSTTGKSSGNGSMKRPWDLRTACKGAIVKPGDSIVIENGTYNGPVTCNLNGTSTEPILVTSAPHGRVLIKSDSKAGIVAFEVVGTYTVYKNIVIDQASPQSLVQSSVGNHFTRVVVRDSSINSGPITIPDSVETISTAQGINTTVLGDYSTGSAAQ